MLSRWIIEKLEVLKDERIVLVQDHLRLLPETEGAVHRFANDNGFTAIIASTNLVFRELLEKARSPEENGKLLLIDRAPARRKTQPSPTKAPPPFYPDLLAETPEAARIDISLRQFLIEKTGDRNWPQEADTPRFARLIAGSLGDVLKAHYGLRTAHPTRFTDHDFRSIVAYSALGVPEAAFKRPEARIYWRIALAGSTALEELDSLAPEVARAIRDELRTAPAPFRWFADSSPEPVVRAFYLSAILSQHVQHWKLVLANIDPDLKPFCEMDASLIAEAALELVSIDPGRADKDLLEAEASLSGEALNLLLGQLELFTGGTFAEVIENERYSVLLRSLALFAALDSLLTDFTLSPPHEKLRRTLFPETDDGKNLFIEQRPSNAWKNLKEAYGLLQSILRIRSDLNAAVKNLGVLQTSGLSFGWFRGLWNDRRVNRLEYYLSALERLLESADFLPRSACDLPDGFTAALERIRKRTGILKEEIHKALSAVNFRYQEMAADQYPSWVASDSSEVRLTSRFLLRCLKPHWDPQKEKAVVFVFDGMRYDIWDELVRPFFEDRMEIIADYPASSLLPSETHISRKAIFAGTFPDSFDMRRAENDLLKEALQRDFGYAGSVEVVNPEGSGTGETVRYRAGNVEFFIFELCDKELHKITVKTLPDGRCVPSRPLAFIYQQHIKNIIENEVTAVIRNLPPDTKVFVVADHGFGAVGRERIFLESSWLNEPDDCHYLNAWMGRALGGLNAPAKVRKSVFEFPVADLRLPDSEEVFDKGTKQKRQKLYESILFPKTGYAFSRPAAKFNPDAYSHGGISIQEMFVPMLAMRVKTPEEGVLLLGAISGPSDLIEGETAEFTMQVRLADSHKHKELRLETQGAYQHKDSTPALPSLVYYVSASGVEVVCRFVPDAEDASDKERAAGMMERILRIGVSYREGQRTVKKRKEIRFSMRLNSEKIVRRVPPHLGKILGLTPRSMR